MVFLTFGTGLGAGFILNGQLYTGTNDNAGEVGHVRLSDYGPVGYGKAGSFEGFCSGGGIAQLAKMRITEKTQMGESVSWCNANEIENITAKTVADAANQGDELALEIFSTVGQFLGKGLSYIIDFLNPEVIVIGSIYARNKELLEPYVLEIIKKEALPLSSKVCTVKAAELGDDIGDYASLSVAVNLVNTKKPC
jgi:glucokinase